MTDEAMAEEYCTRQVLQEDVRDNICDAFLAGLKAGKEIADKENEDIAMIAYLQGAGRAKWHYTKNVYFPTEPGRYLTWLDLHGEQYPQILAFDGKY